MKALDSLYPFCPEVRLFHSEKKFVEWCAKRFGCLPETVDGADAQTTYCDGCAIVLFTVQDDEVWENALLVHEAYHVITRHLEALGEESAGEEIVAYMIQCVAGSLMEAHGRWRRKHAVGDDRQDRAREGRD